jgi:HEAT repeat protein
VRAAVPVLRKTLKDTDARARAQAASALSEAGALAEPAVPELIEMLRNDPEERARLEATLALGNIGPAAKAAVPALVEILRNEKLLSIRVNAAGSLGQIHCDPDLVVPALVEAHLKDAEPEVRQWSMISLLQFGPEALKRSQAAVQSLARDPENKKLPDFEKRLASFTEALERRLKNPGTSPPAKAPSSGPRGPAPGGNSPLKAPGG